MIFNVSTYVSIVAKSRASALYNINIPPQTRFWFQYPSFKNHHCSLHGLIEKLLAIRRVE
jgi:hypothetical protein